MYVINHLTGEPIFPAQTAHQYLARYWFAVRAGKIGWQAIYHKSSPPRDRTPEWGMDRSLVINENQTCNAGGHSPRLCGQSPTQVQRHRVRTVLAKPGVECSPDLPVVCGELSESAPISHRRVGRHPRCSRPTCGGDSIYDKSPDR